MSIVTRRAVVHLRALLLVFCVAFGHAASGQSLFVIPTDSPTGPGVADEQPLLVSLHLREPAALAKVLDVPEPVAGADVLRYVMQDYPAISPGTKRAWSEPSFVVDYLDPSVTALGREFATARAESGAVGPPTPGDLVRFVHGVIRGSRDRGLDVASEIAAIRLGDCKNYAVLTVALARAAGVPARVVVGIVLLRFDTRYGAYGHAWAEVLVDGRWVAADAALTAEHARVRYLPFGVLENEGMGYALDAARLTPVWVQRVEVLGAASTGSPLPQSPRTGVPRFVLR